MNAITEQTGRKRQVLHVASLTKTFKANPALSDVTFSVPEASLTVILGPAGAGKTTTLRLVAGLDQPDSGRIILGGQDMGAREPKDRNVAMIFDTLALYPNKTGFENMAHPLKVRRMAKAAIEEKVTELARTLKVSRLLHRLPKTMSGGERQRIALGRALIRTPSIFLLDEPLSSLDAMLRIELRAELKRLQRELGHTFLMATPDFNEALAVADTVIMLRQGKVVQVAGPQEIYDRPLDRDIAGFVGSPQINLLDAGYASDSGRLSAAGARVPVPETMKHVFADGIGKFVLGIRPENLVPADPASADIKGALIDIEPLGLKSVLTVRNDQAELRVQVDTVETRGLAIGRNMGLKLIHPSKLLGFSSSDGRLLNCL